MVRRPNLIKTTPAANWTGFVEGGLSTGNRSVDVAEDISFQLRTH